VQRQHTPALQIMWQWSSPIGHLRVIDTLPPPQYFFCGPTTLSRLLKFGANSTGLIGGTPHKFIPTLLVADSIFIFCFRVYAHFLAIIVAKKFSCGLQIENQGIRLLSI
jgi:hypothetical protein